MKKKTLWRALQESISYSHKLSDKYMPHTNSDQFKAIMKVYWCMQRHLSLIENKRMSLRTRMSPLKR